MLPAIWLTIIAATAMTCDSCLSSGVMSDPTFITAVAAAANWIAPGTSSSVGDSSMVVSGFTLGKGSGSGDGSGVGVSSGVAVGVGVGDCDGVSCGVGATTGAVNVGLGSGVGVAVAVSDGLGVGSGFVSCVGDGSTDGIGFGSLGSTGAGVSTAGMLGLTVGTLGVGVGVGIGGNPLNHRSGESAGNVSPT